MRVASDHGVWDCHGSQAAMLAGLGFHAMSKGDDAHIRLEDEPTGPVDFRVACVQKDCKTLPREVTKQIPLALAGAVAVCFHSAHEGHLMEMYVDGESVFQHPEALKKL